LGIFDDGDEAGAIAIFPTNGALGVIPGDDADDACGECANAVDAVEILEIDFVVDGGVKGEEVGQHGWVLLGIKC
jgi:hypothetical protein